MNNSKKFGLAITVAALMASSTNFASADTIRVDAYAAEEISTTSEGYVAISDEVLNIYEAASQESKVISTLEPCEKVVIQNIDEDWDTIEYNNSIAYVESKYISDDIEYACTKAKEKNYEKAKINISGDSVRIKSEAKADSKTLGTLDDQSDIIILEDLSDFVKVCYGEDYEEGYIINTSVEHTGEWKKKTEVEEEQNEAKLKKIEQEQNENIAQENAEILGEDAEAAQIKTSSEEAKGQKIVNTALKYLGVPYVWGGTSPSGFDCSGLVQYVCAENGISVNRVAADQRNNGTYVSREDLQPGDLVFFSNGSDIHHVGIYIGDGNMIHAPQTGDVVKISSINTDYRISQYAGAVRVY